MDPGPCPFHQYFIMLTACPSRRRSDYITPSVPKVFTSFPTDMLMVLKWKYGDSRFVTRGRKSLLVKNHCCCQLMLLIGMGPFSMFGEKKKNYQSIGKGQIKSHLWVPKDVHTLGGLPISQVSTSPGLTVLYPFQHKTLHWYGSYLQSCPKLLGCFAF